MDVTYISERNTLIDSMAKWGVRATIPNKRLPSPPQDFLFLKKE
jgi:hypothetical protein